jgi:hypothetical protein
MTMGERVRVENGVVSEYGWVLDESPVYGVLVETEDAGTKWVSPDLVSPAPEPSQKGREYRALKNHLHNTLKISREELKKLVRDAVREMVQDAMDRWFMTTEFKSYVSQQFDWMLQKRKFELQQFAANELMRRFDVKITERAP